jgi:hypothetical protein
MKTKTFDCVDLKRRGAERVQAELDGMTPGQQVEYWRRSTEELLQRKRQLATGPSDIPGINAVPRSPNCT